MRVLLFAVYWSLAVNGQAIDASRAGDSVDITAWRFHAGDDTRWADAAFDDSGWRAINSSRPLREQGLRRVSGLFWLRQIIELPHDAGPVRLLLTGKTSYEVFADGERVGGFGRPGTLDFFYVGMPTFPLPRKAGPVVVAIRFWQWPVWAGAEPAGVAPVRGAVVGPERAVREEARLRLTDLWLSRLPTLVVAALTFIVSGVFLALYKAQRERAEYAWLGLTLLATGFALSFDALMSTSLLPLPIGDLGHTLTNSAADALLLQFLFVFLNLPTGRIMRLYQFVLVSAFLSAVFTYLGWISAPVANTLMALVEFPLYLGTPIVLLTTKFRRNREARLLFWPMLAFGVTSEAGNILWILYVSGFTNPQTFFLHIGPLPLTLEFVSYVAFLLGICAVMFRRFNRIAAERERSAAEMEAARAVQAMLIPDTPPEVPGLAITAAYIPAQEVGGDFFQIIPDEDGAVLVVAGDVSGKGLKAAMVASSIVGALKNESSRRPAEVLSHLNRMLANQIENGFVTCCAARIERDGTFMIANAGQIAPYLNGAELEFEPSLPLGIVAEVEFPEFGYVLRHGDRIAFVSDGVIEARNTTGDLYGFERTGGIARRSAREIAEAARAFGQEDDITAITVERVEAAYAV